MFNFNRRISSICHMRYVRCPDAGVECLGYGEVKLKVEVIRRENLGGAGGRKPGSDIEENEKQE